MVDMKCSLFTTREEHCLLWRVYKWSFLEGMYGYLRGGVLNGDRIKKYKTMLMTLYLKSLGYM